MASEIRVMSAGAVKSMITALGAEFERESGKKLNLNFGTAGSLRERIKNGEVADLVILSESAIAELANLGMVIPATMVDLGRTVTGVVVREGTAAPDISTPQAFKQALIKARSVAYTDPKAGGSGGIMFSALLQRLGVAEEVNKKAVLGKGGHDVATSIAEGRAELGTTFISEVLPVKGAKVIGPLPGELHNANTYTAAVHVRGASPDDAKAFLRKLTDPVTRTRWTAAGLEPAFPDR
ncbi:MAG TPA: substrate-binding domain-containing protein [Pseudolabrys sp.]|nr:substrate-binding domain-containing protein [Pseudolabrys sp.]